MMISLEVTLGIEVDETEARKIAREHVGKEANDMSPEECALIWAEDKFNYGLGVYAKAL